ncbi:unnamed protein product, partial [Mesorhabditis spiculigera]
MKAVGERGGSRQPTIRSTLCLLARQIFHDFVLPIYGAVLNLFGLGVANCQESDDETQENDSNDAHPRRPPTVEHVSRRSSKNRSQIKNTAGRAKATSAVAVRILKTQDEGAEDRFHFNEGTLSAILCDKKYADKKVSVISIAGAFRQGKSFMLNFFMRYLLAVERNRGKEDVNWLESVDPLDAFFSWRNGPEGETNGIHICRPFVLRDFYGEEYVVILMDTQGAFDNTATFGDCTTIFALSTLVSSVQIYNLMRTIGENDLQHLQYFAEFGRMTAGKASNPGKEAKADLNNGAKAPFQTLTFLVRDWSSPHKYPYGYDGGQKYLDWVMQVRPQQHEELKGVRNHIRNCFFEMSCFLMPNPGRIVDESPDFHGDLEVVEGKFKKSLLELIPSVVGNGNHVLKKINGREVTCEELFFYFKAYITVFRDGSLPTPSTMLIATAKAENMRAAKAALSSYNLGMESVCGPKKPYVRRLQATHEAYKKVAMETFRGGMMSESPVAEEFRVELEEDIEVDRIHCGPVTSALDGLRAIS